MTNDMFPLLFQFREVVEGPGGWIAGIWCTGRALLEQSQLDDEHEWWLSSVDLGGLSVGASSPDAVRESFKVAFSEFVFDLSDDCESYGVFQSRLQSMLDSADASALDLWERSLHALRNNESANDDPAVSALPLVESDGFSPTLIVQRLDLREADGQDPAIRQSPSLNQVSAISRVRPAA